MNKMSIKFLLSVLFIVALSFRLILFYTVWSDLRHGSARVYGSTAIGLFQGQGLTYNYSEMSKINTERTNYKGHFPEYYERINRVGLVEFLPGPAILLFSLWKIIPVFNFAPYIWFQIILDSLLIILFYFVFRDYDKKILFITTLFLIINMPVIKRTLMMGYDFWPQFIVLVNFIGISIFLKRMKCCSVLFTIGVLTSFAIWFRSITTFLPFFIAIYLVLYLRLEYKERFKRILICLTFYLLPIVISISLLSIHRYNISGNIRPTRSTFWPMFIGGIGQFSNPYGLKCNDQDIRRFAEEANKDIVGRSSIDTAMPNSSFEITLKKEAYSFISKYPHLVLRNTIYRIGIMLAPILYKDHDFIPRKFLSFLFPLGFPLLLIWFLGINYLFKHIKYLFWLSLPFYLYCFLTFSWIYVSGRIILPFLFINILVYLFGLKYLFCYFRNLLSPKEASN